jgi:outer membrane protein assembly factor BamB
LFTTRSNVTFFAVPYRAWPILKGMLNPKTLGAFFANDRFLMKTGAVGLQFQSSNDMMLHNLFVSFANIDYTKPQTIWESRLDAKVLTAPTIVTNHITHEKEIMVQDEALNLYLISSSGRILWKKNIGEKIKSEIFQIDVLKNGRLQYLFSTISGIHLLDRNGAYLPKFPVKLKLPATNGMALVDFDATRDYRILIACSDNKVYSFDKNGNQLKGWNFGPASGMISLPVQYFKIQNKDYLLVADPVKVYILDRKGAVKVKPEKDFAVSMNSPVNFETVASGKGPRFILTDVDGAVHSIFLDGTVESKSLGTFSPDHFFNVVDINRDGLSEFVFTDRNKFEIYSQAGEKLNSRKLDGNVVTPPVFPVLISKNRKAGLTVPSKNQILLLNGDGTVYEGFPLNGQTPFTIGILEKNTNYQNLLVGGGEAYLYNYAIK